MTGEELYNAWREGMSEQGIMTDEWSDMGPENQEAWNHVAESVSLKINEALDAERS